MLSQRTLAGFRIVTSVVALAATALLALATTGCHWIFGFSAGPQPTNTSYKCSSQIYRDIGDGKFLTEEWEFYDTGTASSVLLDCQAKLDLYIDYQMPPGLPNPWLHTPVTVAEVASKPKFDFCPMTWNSQLLAPPAFGAPVGARIRWNSPPALEASASFSVVGPDGVTRTAEPKVTTAAVDFAERRGMEYMGVYYSDKPHIRVSNIAIELETPFMLGSDAKVTRFYVQNLGTIMAENDGGTLYKVYPQQGYFYVYAEAEVMGETRGGGFCVSSDEIIGFNEYQGPPNASFAFSYTLKAKISGLPFELSIHLSRPAGLDSFQTHQPFVALVDRTSEFPADLAPDVALDLDGDLTRFLWFEDYATVLERFLGEGRTLADVPFDSAVEHMVTLVAYDSKGAYSTASMRLSRGPNLPPVAADDAYTTAEDQALSVPAALGVLANDTDPNGDLMRAVLTTPPQHGTVDLQPDGSFVYTPEANWFGEDSFGYFATDRRYSQSNAIVQITVTAVNDAPIAVGDAFTASQCTPLVVAAPGVLGNDLDPDTPLVQLSAIPVGPAAHGSAVLASDGSFTYTPAGSFVGQDAFTYRVSDGLASSGDASVVITVAALPVAQEIEKCVKGAIPPDVVPGIAKSLLVKLDQAIAKYQAGQVVAACNLLTAFLNEVASLVADGVLSAGEGASLSDAGLHVAASMSCN